MELAVFFHSLKAKHTKQCLHSSWEQPTEPTVIIPQPWVCPSDDLAMLD